MPISSRDAGHWPAPARSFGATFEGSAPKPADRALPHKVPGNGYFVCGAQSKRVSALWTRNTAWSKRPAAPRIWLNQLINPPKFPSGRGWHDLCMPVGRLAAAGEPPQPLLRPDGRIRRPCNDAKSAAANSSTLARDGAVLTGAARLVNGFFAGYLGLDAGGITVVSPEQGAALFSGITSFAEASPDDNEAPWHDPAMSLPDRMKLAEGRPLRRRMMAAMGQQDCGQCGYNCQDYSDAIVLQKEERLNLCVPGGKETTRMLKALHQELGSTTATTPAKTPSLAGATAAPAA